MEISIPRSREAGPLASGGVVAFLLVLSALGSAAAVDDGAPPGRPVDLVWHNGELWNSVVLGHLHANPPPQTLDPFYTFPGVQNPVAGAGPGDSDYNGGRWQPYACTGGGSYTDGDQVEAAIAAGTITCTPAGDPFLCPLTDRNDED